MIKISTKYIAQAIYASAKGKSGSELERALANSVEFLAKKNLLSKAPEILNLLEQTANADQNIVSAKIKSKLKLSEQKKDSLRQSLINRYKAKDLKLKLEEDPSLLGGIRIEAEGEVIDLSLKNKLHQLQTYLINN